MSRVQTRVLIETQEISIIKRRWFSVRAYCETCQREVRMLSPDDAAMLVCEETDKIYSLIGTREIHCRCVDGRRLLVCLPSLSSI